MDEIDELKILIALVAAIGSNFLPLLKEDEAIEEKEKLKNDFIILIRIIILLYSINYKWPLVMCATISVVISAVTKVSSLFEFEEKMELLE